MIKKRILHITGIFYIFLGFIVLLNSFQTITGFAIIEDLEPKITSILGIILISLGLLISMVAREKESVLEKKISVFNSKRGKIEDENYMMSDPELYFEQSGAISLGRFKREINQLKQGEGGEELVKIIREAYEPSLKELAESNDREKAPIAGAFLRILDPNYNPPFREQLQDSYELSREEREEVKNAFRTYDGRLTTEQKNVLRKYNLIYDKSGGGEAKIRYHGIGYTVTVSRTPSDRRAGLNMVVDIVDLIEKGRKHGLEKKSKKNEES